MWAGLESFTPCNIFETKPIEEDCYEHEVDRYSQGHEVVNEYYLISDNDGHDNYWTFIENPIHETFGNLVESPIYDTSREGSVDLETLGNLGRIIQKHTQVSIMKIR